MKTIAYVEYSVEYRHQDRWHEIAVIPHDRAAAERNAEQVRALYPELLIRVREIRARV